VSENSPADTAKSLVQSQFGASAEAYATSQVHARGASLGRLVQLAEVGPTDRVLDVATAAGHTALALAPLAHSVLGVDLTPQMLDVARRLARERGLSNVEFAQGDAEHLPVPDGSFDRVVCRIALHHFPNAQAAASEMARALKPGGRLALVDNIVPPDPEAAAFINRFETLRDPSHHWLYSLDQLADLFREAGLTVVHTETLVKPMQFHDWAARMNTPAALEEELWVSLEATTGILRDYFEPREVDGERQFNLHEGIVVAVK
jgi:ubiquinone/menaquinone biosynthesis C-methylase UbiE